MKVLSLGLIPLAAAIGWLFGYLSAGVLVRDRLGGPVRTRKIGEIEWCPNHRNAAKSNLAVNIRTRNINITLAAWLLAGRPERVTLGWDGAGRRIAIVPNQEGQFQVNGKRTIRIGGALTVAWLTERGVKPGKYPVTWDKAQGMLVAEVGKP